MCKAGFQGRTDKIFCSVSCKSAYHYKLKSVTDSATYETDKFLHRNRSILLEVMGKNAQQKMIDRKILDRKRFKYDLMTGTYVNARGKRYHIVYDFSWMAFKDGRIFIVRRS